MIKNVNTIEEYRGLDKGSMLNKAAHTVCLALGSSARLCAIIEFG